MDGFTFTFRYYNFMNLLIMINETPNFSWKKPAALSCGSFSSNFIFAMFDDKIVANLNSIYHPYFKE